MKFENIKPGVLSRTPWHKDRLFYKVLDAQPWPDLGSCSACGTVAVWNARVVETDRLVYFCRDKGAYPAYTPKSERGRMGSSQKPDPAIYDRNRESERRVEPPAGDVQDW